MKKSVAVMSLTLMGLSCSAVSADTVYVGLGYGATSFKLSNGFDTACAEATNCATHDSGVRTYVGLNIDSSIAVEAGYMHFGSADMTGPGGYAKVSASALTLNVALRKQFIPEFAGVLRLGVARERESLNSLTSSLGYLEGSDAVTKPYWGLGAEYKLTRSLTGFFAADFTRTSYFRNEMYSFGVQAGF